MKSMIMNRKTKQIIENDRDSLDQHIPIIFYGASNTATNYVSDVTFSKTNTPGLRESRYFSNMNGSLSLLSNVYDLSFTFNKRAGNTYFFPGTIFDFRLTDKGLGNCHDDKSMAFHMGFGGYHIVTSVTYNLTPYPKDYVVTVKAKFLDTKAPSKLAREAPDNRSDLERSQFPNQCDILTELAEQISTNQAVGRDTSGVYDTLDSIMSEEDSGFLEAEVQRRAQESAADATRRDINTLYKYTTDPEFQNSLAGGDEANIIPLEQLGKTDSGQGYAKLENPVTTTVINGKTMTTPGTITIYNSDNEVVGSYDVMHDSLQEKTNYVPGGGFAL